MGYPFLMGVYMSMVLSIVTDDDNVLNKTKTGSITRPIKLPIDIDVNYPVLLVSPSIEFDYSLYNYVEIPELKRSYFMTVERATPKLLRLLCRVDLLDSYKDDILQSKALLMRGVKTGDYFDGSIDASVKQSVTLYHSDGGLIADEHTNILSTVGVRVRIPT